MNKLACVCLAVIFLVVPLMSMAQTPTSPQDNEQIVSGTTEVLLDAVVKDKKGRLVKDLKPTDFQIMEDGVSQEIRSFRLVTGETEPTGNAAPNGRPDVIRRVRENFNSGRIGAVAIVFDRLSLDSRKRAHDAALSYA